MGHRDEPTAPGQRPAQRAEHTVAGGVGGAPSPLNGPGPAQPGNRSPGRGGVPRRDVGRAARAALWIAAYFALFAAVLMIPTLVNWWREARRDPGGLPPRGADHPGRPRTTRRHRGWQRWWCSSCRCSASRRTSRNSVMGGRADSRMGLAGCGRKATTDRSSPLPASPLCRASTVTATG